ncbi:MAG: metallophosphoesterase, partial [Aeoliella sp.]
MIAPCRLAATILLLFVPALSLDAHPGGDHDPAELASDKSTGVEPSAVELPKALVLPAIDGPQPWSEKPVLDDPERFQIAIMTDRTGGHRPGIWMDAVSKLNQLRPEFVMSVGDLIEGYTGDRPQVEREWQEFLGFVDQMDMRFFFVAGNHDLTNPMMHQVWREHFGPEWYSFDYKRVHFVCLSSEDPVDRLGDEQLAWLKEDLAKHANARWTLLFLHKPLWVRAERDLSAGNADRTNWKQVERLLVDRPHTVFAGHVHHYVQYERNGREYYSLGTTGGASQLRGNAFGEFDHVMWLTMESDGPHLINLRLDGMLPANVVTEQSIGRFNQFLTKTSVEVAPILIENADIAGFSEGEISIRLSNDFDEPVEMVGTIDGLPLRGLTVDPMDLKLAAAPNAVAELRVRVQFAEPVQFETLARTALTAKLRTTGESPLQSERIVPVVIDRRFAFPALATMPEIDGVIEEWPDSFNATRDEPLLLGNVRSWQGQGDGSAEFYARQVGDKAYVAVRVTDDRVIPAGDRVELLIDPRGVDARSRDPRYVRTGLTISGYAPSNDGQSKVDARRFRNDRIYRNVEAKSKRTDKGYDLELAIPLNLVKEIQGRDWHSLQGTVVVHDTDEPDERPTEIVWRGTPRVRE